MKTYFVCLLMVFGGVSYAYGSEQLITCGHILDSEYVSNCVAPESDPFRCGFQISSQTVIEPWLEMWLRADGNPPETYFLSLMSELFLFSNEAAHYRFFSLAGEHLRFELTTVAGEESHNVEMNVSTQLVREESKPGSVVYKGQMVYSLTPKIPRESRPTSLDQVVPFACQYQ